MQSFEEQVHLYQDRVYGFAFYMLHDRQEAEDVTQEVLLRLWEHRSELDEARALGWLLRVARNACIDVLRRRKMHRRVLTVDTDGVQQAPSRRPSPQADTEATDFQEHLERALSRLDEPYRSLIVLREVQGLSYREICGAMDLPLNTVKVYLHRARHRLREQLQAMMEHETP